MGKKGRREGRKERGIEGKKEENETFLRGFLCILKGFVIYFLLS